MRETLRFIVETEKEYIKAGVYLRTVCKLSARTLALLKREQGSLLRNGELLRTIDLLKHNVAVGDYHRRTQRQISLALTMENKSFSAVGQKLFHILPCEDALDGDYRTFSVEGGESHIPDFLAVGVKVEGRINVGAGVIAHGNAGEIIVIP